MRHNQGFWKEGQFIIILDWFLDLLDYNDVVKGSGFLLLLLFFIIDFYKTFDAIEHPFILKTLQHLHFLIKN